MEQNKKISDLYDAHEKSISSMTGKKTIICSMKGWKTFYKKSEQIDFEQIRDLEESLIVISRSSRRKIKYINKLVECVQNEMSESKA